MLKKTISYTDFDGNAIEEEFHFNLSKAEIAEMELSQEGGLATYLRKIVEQGDPKVILATFKEIISKSVGRRSEDGRRFVKTPEITDDFLHSGAYDELFMEMVTDAAKATEFIKGVIPSDLSSKMAQNAVPSHLSSEVAQPTPGVALPASPTKKTPQEMTREELVEAMQLRNALKGQQQDQQ